MKIVFFGAGTFGIPALRALAQSAHTICGVVTSPKRRSGRGQHSVDPPVRVCAAEHGLKVLECSDVVQAESIQKLTALQADVFVVVSFGTIFSDEVLRIPRYGCVNVHASLLPKYRGAAPVAHAILNGDTTTGITIIKLSGRLDAGDIVLQETLSIDDDENAAQLTGRLAEQGASVLIRALDCIERDSATLITQDNTVATRAPKLTKRLSWIDWSLPARDIHNHVRAFIPWPGSRVLLHEKEVIILQTAWEACGREPQAAPGTILGISDDRGIAVATGNGKLFVKSVKPAGKRAMHYKDFVNGNRINRGDRFAAPDLGGCG